MSQPLDAHVLSVNVAQVRPNPYKTAEVTGMDKRPVTGPVHVRAPGTIDAGAGSGLVGDTIGDRDHHGGDSQAVYAYAREELDWWQPVLGRALADGAFGENLTTRGVDVSGALIGERWQVGEHLVLEVTAPRIPCATFRGWVGQRGWLRTFVAGVRPGAYLRVAEPGDVRAGDSVTVSERPTHGVTIALTFRALMSESDLLPRIITTSQLPEELRSFARSRLGR